MKILFCLCRTLGDVILGSTIIEEIKKKYPDSDITWAIWPQYSEIADTNPHVKSLFLATDWNAVLREMSSGKYDMVLCPYMTNHTATIWHQVEKYKHGHLLDFYAKRCNIEITDRREYMYPTEKDYENIKKDNITNPEIEELSIVVHGQSLVKSKDWPYFNDLIPKIKNLVGSCKLAKDMCIYQIGGPNDIRIDDTTDLRGKLKYNEIAALLATKQLFIGIDSGLAYIASAMNCPNIVIMGMSTGSTSGPIGKHTTFIEPYRPDKCKKEKGGWPCHCNCKNNNPCINTITVEIVLDTIKKALAEKEVLENGKNKQEGKDGVVAENKPEGKEESGSKD